MDSYASQEIDELRREASRKLDPERRAELGQFLTPSAIAGFMASLFRRWPAQAHLLDPGAGIGSLTEAFVREFCLRQPGIGRVQVSAFEIDSLLAGYLKDTLSNLKLQAAEAEVDFRSEIHERDFIYDACLALDFGSRPYTHAILNPPYLKIRSNSTQRRWLRQAGLDVVNMYSAFLGLAVAQTKDGGEIVAIVPRSFCNGTYFLPFRRWLLEHASIKRLHVFESRNSAFSDDDVLQENVIIHLERSGCQGSVTISNSSDSTFDDLIEREVDFSDVVSPADGNAFIHIPLDDVVGLLSGFSCSLDQLGLHVSTGPVVDFRVTDDLLARPAWDSAALLYAHHFAGGQLVWPREHKKPNAIRQNESTKKLLMPNGWYVVTRRLSAKEEPRRIVAHVVDPDAVKREWIGFENHLNVFHAQKAGFDPLIARGLALFLNSEAVDKHFRKFSGHTQVNATDLRALPYPTIEQLTRIGRWTMSHPRSEQLSLEDYMAHHGDE